MGPVEAKPQRAATTPTAATDPWVIYDWRIAGLNVAARFGATVVGAEVQPRFDQTDLRRNSNRPGSQVVAFGDLCNCARRVRHGE
jgi:hypothetical protein